MFFIINKEWETTNKIKNIKRYLVYWNIYVSRRVSKLVINDSWVETWFLVQPRIYVYRFIL